MCKVSARWCSLLLGTSLLLGIPRVALAQTSLRWAKVERLRNRVHLIPSDSNARLARVADVMNIGDALRTASSARAELRFNDGSLARVGEQATFRFTPDTRNFQLSNGTVLLLIPPGRGRTTIQTPNAVTGIQGSALFVRVRCLAELSAEAYCDAPVTFVGALTNNPVGAMVAYNDNGSQQQPIYAGEIVVIEGDNITERFEFDLRTFYQTSGLAEGLQLDSPTPPETLSEELQEVWQEIQDALELQGDFDNQDSTEEVVENPGFIAPVVSNGITNDAELDEAVAAFADFPSFASSPAAAFHGLSGQIATQPSITTTGTASETLEDGNVEASLITPVTSARVRDNLNANSSGNQEPRLSVTVVSQPTVASPTTPPTQTPAVVTSAPAPVVNVVEAPRLVESATSTPVVNTVGEVTPIATPIISEPVEATPTPVIISNPVEAPIATPEVAPVPVAEPIPVVATQDITPEPANIPSAVVPPTDTPIVTPEVAPTPVAEPIPVVATQDITSEPANIPSAVVPSTDASSVVPVIDAPVSEQPDTIVPEADQTVGREALPEGAFDWDQPAGANTPEVLQTSDLPINEAGVDSSSEPTIEISNP